MSCPLSFRTSRLRVRRSGFWSSPPFSGFLFPYLLNEGTGPDSLEGTSQLKKSWFYNWSVPSCSVSWTWWRVKAAASLSTEMGPVRCWTTEEEWIKAVFSLSTVHPLRLLSALAPERKEKEEMRLPWQSHGSDSPHPLQRAQVQSLVRELRSPHPICQAAKKKKKQERKQGNWMLRRGLEEGESGGAERKWRGRMSLFVKDFHVFKQPNTL